MAFAQLYKITENDSKLLENTDKLNFDYSSPQSITVGSAFLLLFGIFIDITSIAIACFYLNKLLRTDQLPILLKILREESRKNLILPSWKPTPPEPPKESIDPTSCAELSSETYQTKELAPLPNYVRATRRAHKSTYFSFPVNNQTSQTAHESLNNTTLTLPSTNCCNVRTKDIQSSQLKTSRTSQLSSRNYQDSSITSSARNYEIRQNFNDSNFITQQRKRLCAKRNVPDAIKLWLTESQEDDSMDFKTSYSRLSYSENSEYRRPSKKCLRSADRNGNLFHPNTDLNSFKSKTLREGCVDNFNNENIKDPLGIERLNSHDKVRNYLCDLKAQCSSPLPEFSEEKTKENCKIIKTNPEADHCDAEKTELNAERFSDFECRSTGAGDSFHNRKMNIRQTGKPTAPNAVLAEELTRNLSQSTLNRSRNDARGMNSESRSLENDKSREYISPLDSELAAAHSYRRIPSTSDLTNISMESEFTLNCKTLEKPATSMMNAYARQDVDITEKTDEAIACKLHNVRGSEEAIVTCTETFSSEIPQKDPPLQVDRLEVPCEEVVPENSSSDSLSSESTVDHRSPEKFASETNSLWQMMSSK